MVPTKITARKFTGGKAPRKQLATRVAKRMTWSAERKAFIFVPPEDVAALVPSRDVRKSPSAVSNLEIVLGFTNEYNIAKTEIEELPIFDFDDKLAMETYQPGFTTRREPALGKLTKMHKNYLDAILTKAQTLYPGSAYVLMDNNVTPEERDPMPQRKKILKKILKTGRLNGCDLRGSKETGQFGLVANRRLQKGMPIAVDCGSLWSETLHDEWLEEICNKMPALSTTEIPMDLFKGLFSAKEWRNKFSKVATKNSFVVDRFSEGNEVKHLDDAGWLLLHENQTNYNANVEAMAILSLSNKKFMTIVYCVNEDVEKGKSLPREYMWCRKSGSFPPHASFRYLQCCRRGIDYGLG